MIYIDDDIAPTNDCVNPDSYDEICVRCNKCGRFDVTESEDEKYV